ncbi:MAG: hypothetical protein IT536_12565 [Hyphomicrobiales bacterium]|nr:hypothetical protein [Hyphomicrobiales bacterium]
MHKISNGCFAMSLAIAAAASADAVAAGGSFVRGCAARDMQVMLMIETSPLAAPDKDNAVRAIMHARLLCFEGQVMDALALYDGIAQGLASDWVLSAQQP